MPLSLYFDGCFGVFFIRVVEISGKSFIIIGVYMRR